MKPRLYFVVTIFVLGFAFAAFAQGQRGMLNYNPKAEVTVKGTIQEVQELPAKGGGLGTRTHLRLKTDAGALSVHVGPSAYIAKKQFSFPKGDHIEVLGSKVPLVGQEALLAREITKGGKTLVLRNTQGVPEWAGTRQKH